MGVSGTGSCSSTICFFGAIWERRLRGATGGGGLLGVVFAGGGGDEAREAVCGDNESAAATAISKEVAKYVFFPLSL